MADNKYYEGILQLRNCTEEAIIFVRNKIDKEKGAAVAKEIKINNGIDLYLSSNRFLKRIGKQLKERFSGIIKASSKLHTVDKHTGKRVYRGTILFRMADFKIGDIGMFKGDEVKILSINNKVMVQDTKTGKKKTYKFDEVEKSFKIL